MHRRYSCRRLNIKPSGVPSSSRKVGSDQKHARSAARRAIYTSHLSNETMISNRAGIPLHTENPHNHIYAANDDLLCAWISDEPRLRTNEPSRRAGGSDFELSTNFRLGSSVLMSPPRTQNREAETWRKPDVRLLRNECRDIVYSYKLYATVRDNS